MAQEAFPLLDAGHGGGTGAWDAVVFSERAVLPTSTPILPLAAGAPCTIAPCVQLRGGDSGGGSGTDASKLDTSVTRSTAEVLERFLKDRFV